jgi:hypothetical protein
MEADRDKTFVREVCLPFLRDAQNVDGGWGFHPQSVSRVEPTCWALQAVAGSSNGVTEAGVGRGLQFLRETQLSDGSWPSTPEQKSGCWLTSLSIWVLLILANRSTSPAASAGLRWLCNDWPQDSTRWGRLLRRLTSQKEVHPIKLSYRGWSWTPGTSSWVEPTSFALIALERGFENVTPSTIVKRRRELATAMLYDRMCPGGGWNCGNPRVYGVPGEPLVIPTVWALIALRRNSTRRENRESLDWLEQNVANIRSAASLALAKICVETYGRTWPAASPTLAGLFENNGFRENVPVVAWSCLAMSERSGWLDAGTPHAK